MNSKEIRYAAGKEAYERNGPMKPIAEKYGVTIAALRSWMLDYMEKNNILSSKSECNFKNTENMTEKELRSTIMKLEIENERLKKGYMVKGGGSKKEYITSLEKNLK